MGSAARAAARSARCGCRSAPPSSRAGSPRTCTSSRAAGEDQARARTGREPHEAVRRILQRHPHLEGCVGLEGIGAVVLEHVQQRPGMHQKAGKAAGARAAAVRCARPARCGPKVSPVRGRVLRGLGHGLTFELACMACCRLQPTARRVRCFQSYRDFYRICAPPLPERGAERPQRSRIIPYNSCFPGYRSMNTKLALSAVVAALMLTACAKQESAGTEAAAPAAAAAAATDAAASGRRHCC